jgi:MFS transporter, NNP family, nitrate/nitrite transporter
MQAARNNGATFQLVPLRWLITTAVAGGMIGEIGALGGSILPNLLGQSRQRTGSYTAGFVTYAVLAFLILILLRVVSKRWTTTWVGSGGRALREDAKLALAGDLLPAN